MYIINDGATSRERPSTDRRLFRWERCEARCRSTAVIPTYATKIRLLIRIPRLTLGRGVDAGTYGPPAIAGLPATRRVSPSGLKFYSAGRVDIVVRYRRNLILRSEKPNSIFSSEIRLNLFMFHRFVGPIKTE